MRSYAKIAETIGRAAKSRHMTAGYSLMMLLHLTAIALWLGAMVFFLIVMGPAVHEMEANIAMPALNRARIGFEAISWTGIGLLFVTGIANLALRNPAAGAPDRAYMILLGGKLFVFLAMTVHHCLQVFKYAPRIAQQTAAMDPGEEVWSEALLNDWRRWFMLLKLNAGLGPLAVLLGLALAKS